jgi:hypothetical protein
LSLSADELSDDNENISLDEDEKITAKKGNFYLMHI